LAVERQVKQLCAPVFQESVRHYEMYYFDDGCIGWLVVSKEIESGNEYHRNDACQHRADSLSQ